MTKEKHDCIKEHPGDLSHEGCKNWCKKQQGEEACPDDVRPPGILNPDSMEESDELEEGNPIPHPDEVREEANENWFKGNKDQLLFEELIKKWTK